jgi:hypothetical protein
MNNGASTPQRAPNSNCPWADELIDLPYESPESSVACEWSATCGGLSIPMMRSPGARLELKPFPPVMGPSGAVDDRPTWRCAPMHLDDDVQLFIGTRLEERSSDIHGQESKSILLSSRITSRDSLSSPFPMQFRTRAKADGTLSPRTQETSSSSSPPPPPPPLPRVRLPSRQRRSIACSSDESTHVTSPVTIPPPPPPPTRRRQSASEAGERTARNDEALRTAANESVEATPLARVQSSAAQPSKTKLASAGNGGTGGGTRKLLPPTIPDGSASAAQRSKAIWAAKRMARSIRRRRPTSAKSGGVCAWGGTGRPFNLVTRSVLDQDTEDDQDDSSTGSTATSFVDEDGDAYASDEENIVRIVS